jgi:hypothetical protein
MVGVAGRAHAGDRAIDLGPSLAGGFGPLDGAALVTVMQAPPLYHTTGEVLDVISTPGLERMARILAFFVRESSRAATAELKRPLP